MVANIFSVFFHNQALSGSVVSGKVLCLLTTQESYVHTDRQTDRQMEKQSQ